jgi:hypothetical protein
MEAIFASGKRPKGIKSVRKDLKSAIIAVEAALEDLNAANGAVCDTVAAFQAAEDTLARAHTEIADAIVGIQVANEEFTVAREVFVDVLESNMLLDSMVGMAEAVCVVPRPSMSDASTTNIV